MATTEPTSVCITGLGAVSCAGLDVESLWQAALRSHVCAGWFDEPVLGRQVACCRVSGALPTPRGMRAVDFARLDRFAQLGVVAGQQAWGDAALRVGTLDRRRIAVITGTSRGPMGESGASSAASAASASSGPAAKVRRVRPTASVFGSASSLSGALARWTGARGPSLTVSATCASSSAALGLAALQITSGAVDVALVGGADAPLHPQFLAELQATGVLGRGNDPAEVCRPCDRGRTGIAIGEAGAYLVLESSQHARDRGARVRAELV